MPTGGVPLASWCPCREIRTLSLSHSSAEKLANLILNLSAKSGETEKVDARVRLVFTHEEIGQMIGTSRETVTRHCAK